MSTRITSTNGIIIVALLALTIGGLGVALFAAPSRSAVVEVKLPLELPAIGNIEQVKEWRFGRIEGVVTRGDSDDITVRIRTEDGKVHEVIGPRVLGELARESNWVEADSNTGRVPRADYIERMIAFDVDDAGRIIAMISLEPMDRDRRKLERAL